MFKSSQKIARWLTALLVTGFQTVNLSAEESAETSETKKPELEWNQQVLFLFENKEWMSGHVPGYTDFGWASPVSVSYQPDENTTLSVGAFLSKRYSQSADINSKPLFQLQHQLSPKQLVTAGSFILPTELHEALAENSRWLDLSSSEGLTWSLAGKSLNADIWLDWQVLESLDIAERFYAGYRLAWLPTPNIQLTQSLIHRHTDGQITFDPTSIRIYGRHSGITWQSNSSSSEIDFQFGLNHLASNADINEVISDGSGLEVFLLSNIHTKNWNQRLRLSHYQGQPQVAGGYAFYRFSELSRIQYSATYLASKQLRIELAFDLDLVEQKENTSQTVNFHWNVGSNSFIQ